MCFSYLLFTHKSAYLLAKCANLCNLLTYIILGEDFEITPNVASV